MDEYLFDEVTSGSDNEKKIQAAEQKALRKKKNALIAKSGQKLSICLFFLFGRFAHSLFLKRFAGRILQALLYLLLPIQ